MQVFYIHLSCVWRVRTTLYYYSLPRTLFPGMLLQREHWCSLDLLESSETDYYHLHSELSLVWRPSFEPGDIQGNTALSLWWRRPEIMSRSILYCTGIIKHKAYIHADLLCFNLTVLYDFLKYTSNYKTKFNSTTLITQSLKTYFTIPF